MSRIIPMCSVIIPVYNKEPYLKQTLRSLSKQIYVNWEALLVDDCSTDKSRNIIDNFAQNDPRFIPIFLNKNRGAQHARNIGIQHATGDYIIFLDADDYLYPDALQTRVRFIEENQDLNGVVFGAEVYNEANQCVDVLDFSNHGRGDLEAFLKGQVPWTIMQPLWRYDAIKRVGYWDENIKVLQDQEFHIRALLKGLTVKKIQKIDSRWNRVQANSISKKGWHKEFLESHYYFLEKIYKMLLKYENKPKYFELLASRYFWLAKLEMRNHSHKKGFLKVWNNVNKKKLIPYHKYLTVKIYYYLGNRRLLKRLYIFLFRRFAKEFL